MGQTTTQRSFPIVEMSESHLLQDSRKGRCSSERYTPVIYTPARSLRDPYYAPVKKEGEHEVALLHDSNNTKHGEVIKDPLLWASAKSTANAFDDEEQQCAMDIPMLAFSSKRINNIYQTLARNEDTSQLYSKVQQLEQKLQDLQRKDLQLQAAKARSEQISLLNANLKETLETTVRQKDAAIQKLEGELVERQMLQYEIVNLQSCVQKMEVNMLAANMKVQTLEEQLAQLVCQLANRLQNHPAAYSEHDQVDETNLSQCVGDEQVEAVRLKYFEAITAARENPSDDALLLASELREKLKVLADLEWSTYMKNHPPLQLAFI